MSNQIHSPDPLIDEVRERRRKVFEENGATLDGLFEAIRRLQEGHPEKIVTRKPRPLSDRKKSNR